MKMGQNLKGCGNCEPCTRSTDCGCCINCLKMKKFDGNSENSENFELICDRRQCENGDILIETEENCRIRQKSAKIDFENSEKIAEENGKKFYDSVRINSENYQISDCVKIHSADLESPASIGKILSIFIKKKTGDKCAHIRWFCTGNQAIFNFVDDPKELFAEFFCEDVLLCDFLEPVQVQYCPVSENWSSQGGNLESLITPTSSIGAEKNIFWFRHLYDAEKARFERVPETLLEEPDGINCNSCQFFNIKSESLTPVLVENRELYYKEQIFRIGDGLMLMPHSINFEHRQKKGFKMSSKIRDPQIYTESWRKKVKKVESRGNTENMNDPFDIGIIEEFSETKNSGIKVRVRILYRPENTVDPEWYKQDANKLYWSEEFTTVNATAIEGKCFILPRDKIKEDFPFLWSQKGTFRFYFQEAYDKLTQEFVEASLDARDYEPPVEIEDFPSLETPLNMLDVFAGCGGLSIGLEQSGVAVAKWGIEWDQAAAAAFKKNHPTAEVITEDVNKILKEIMDNDGKAGPKSRTRKFPQKGEVELLCGGPPCQGFSLLNSFTEGDASRFKNSLISTYLSFCDYYRPKYFILENVKNFAAFNEGHVLRLCMRALVLMGYQCQFGVLQSGNFGVAQNRKRAILFAASPHVKLPHFPAATHVFEKMSLSVTLDGKTFDVNSLQWRNDSAPMRYTSVKDAISDLPADCSDVQYKTEPNSHFQRMMRYDEDEGFPKKVTHHEVRKLSVIIKKRLELIPVKKHGADWRDLPNVVIQLEDGRMTQKIKYPYIDHKFRKPAVCSCAKGPKAKCTVMDRQELTLIPWALAHTANSHNHWSGLYSRVHWHSYFSTVVTNVHPDGKQGRVIHPEENRLLSVRECARAQGFPDSAKFCGSIVEQYRQIGNAVPPPLGKALGNAILCAQDDSDIIY